MASRIRTSNFASCESTARRGWQVFNDHVDHVSGAKDKRNALDRMMAEASRRQFDAVAVWMFDRFARSVSHLLRALETFRAESSL